MWIGSEREAFELGKEAPCRTGVAYEASGSLCVRSHQQLRGLEGGEA